MRVIVYHQTHGCETGCCGHVIEVLEGSVYAAGPSGRIQSFQHPYGKEDPRAFAEHLIREELGPEHVKDLDWDNCRVEED